MLAEEAADLLRQENVVFGSNISSNVSLLIIDEVSRAYRPRLDIRPVRQLGRRFFSYSIVHSLDTLPNLSYIIFKAFCISTTTFLALDIILRMKKNRYDSAFGKILRLTRVLSRVRRSPLFLMPTWLQAT